MTASIREQLIQAVIGRLQGLETILPQHVYRSRVLAITRDHTPAIVLLQESESFESLMNAGANRVLTLNVEVYTRGEEPDRLADEIIVEVDTALLGDIRWSGLAVNTQPASDAVQWDFADADQSACRVTLRYEIRYLTALLDQTQVF